MITIPILFEDAQFLCVNKPPGIVVNRADSVTVETIQDWVMRVYPDLPREHEEFYSRAGIVHRIDKETSGCLLIAKNPTAFEHLQAQFKERTIKKTYLAIAHGILVPEEGEIRAPVGRLPWNRERFGILPGGKEAVTRYKTIKTEIIKKDIPVTLVALFPETGRTHQIRVHLKYINHPIVSDFQYAGRKTSRNDRLWAPRVMLHAWKISCVHPTLGTAVSIEAPVPEDMNAIVAFQGEQ
jgi:23S rRNA pseudouridine1911/1915/1917 synthase